MNLNIINGIMVMCINGWFACEKNYEKPTIKYYESGKSCYIEGIFYQSCPPRKYR
jgi:hypothetical protein